MVELFKWYKENDRQYYIFSNKSMDMNNGWNIGLHRYTGNWGIERDCYNLSAFDLNGDRPVELDTLEFSYLMKFMIYDVFNGAIKI